MRTKGVLVLGLILCWTALCSSEDGSMYDYGIKDTLSKELAGEYLLMADACESNPCKNGGKCSDNEGSAKCTCIGTYTGERCEINVCDPDPCKNGGKCSNNEGAPKCTCIGTFTGEKCETNVCDPDPCKNGGKCSINEGRAKCTCTGTFTGDTCEEDVCQPNPCKNGGVCSKDNNKPKCTCTRIWKGDTCEQKCDCGTKGTCSFKNGVKTCACDDDYAERNGKCAETCTEDDCGYGSECADFGGSKFCNCSRGLIGDKCSTISDCGENKKFQNCRDGRGKCQYDQTNKIAICTCDDGKEVDPDVSYCKKTCEGDSDCNGDKCTEKKGKKFCKCRPELEGDKCEIIKDCKSGKYKNCHLSGGECKINGTVTTCECLDEKVLDTRDPTNQFCRTKCTADCQNGGKCNKGTQLCDCNPKTSGDKCETIEGCDPLNCTMIAAECVYDIDSQGPTCKCDDDRYYYENRECNPEWCKDGCNTEVSKCNFKNGIGSCTCKDENKYYSFTDKNCKPIDKCLNVTCGENKICSDGVCKCEENYKKFNNTCERKDLCKDKCFPGANCEDASDFGFVRCVCNSDSKYYLNGKCEDGTCFLPNQRMNCSKSCPGGMERVDGECKYKKDENKCGDDCGFLGWCYNENNTTKCICDPNYAQLNTTTKKCVLKTSVCPKNIKRDGNDKCKCTGKYKQAKNGITCELKSCSDDEVKKECKDIRAAKCVENWKRDVGYECVCPEGYTKDGKKGCIDPCNQDDMKAHCASNGQVCYIGAKDKLGDCRCPPSFTFDTTKKTCEIKDAKTFMIPALPVSRKTYEVDENNINEVVLSRDITNAMTLTYTNLDFAQLYNFKLEKDVIYCDVWLQFLSGTTEKFNATSEILRWVHQLRRTQNFYLLPPRLLLTNNIAKATKAEELSLCTTTVQQEVCGKGSTCGDKGCSCGAGYREIESTIKISGNKRLVRCEDIDECNEESHKCSANSKCVNTPGDYFCACNSGYKKAKGDANALDKEACIGLCDPNPCEKGTCSVTKEFTVDCTCQVGYTGSYCKTADVNLAKAGKATKVVGAVLGTLLAIVIVLIIVYIVRQRKNSYSEDFTPAPRVDNAEMAERRPMRGVTNRGYQ